MSRKELIDVHDVAELLNVSAFTVRNLVNNKELSFVKMGNRYKFTKEQVGRFVINSEINGRLFCEKYECVGLLTSIEVAEILGCSKYTVCNLVAQGKLSYLDFGGRYRFRKEVINSYIESKTEEVSILTSELDINDYSFLTA